jgi:hypothetical protein
MKRFVRILSTLILICLFMSACTTSQKPVNGFKISGESYSSWFLISSQDLLNTLNDKLKGSDYPQLEVKETSEEEFIHFVDGEKSSSTYDIIEIVSHQEGTIKSLSCNIKVTDEYTAKKSGFYYQMLIELFSPRNADKIMKGLYIFEGIPKEYAQSLYEDGNTIYSYTGSSLRIHAADYVAPASLPQKPN